MGLRSARCPSVGPAWEYEVFVAAGLVEVAGHDDWAVIRCGFAIDKALRVKCLRSAAAVGNKFSDVAGVDTDKPGKLDHFSEGHAAEIEFEAGDDNVITPVQ